MTFAEVIKLTDRQKQEIILHKRTKDGGIAFPDDAPPESQTLEDHLRDAERLAAFLAVTDRGEGTPEEKRRRIADELKAKLRDKYGSGHG